MLKGSQSPFTEDKLANLLLPSLISLESSSAVSLRNSTLRTAIHSRLWHLALENTRRLKTLRKRSLTFPTTLLDRRTHPRDDNALCLLLSQQNFGNFLSVTNTDSQNQQSEGYEIDFASLLIESSCQSEFEDQILDNCSETSFTDIGESTQTSFDTLFSTAVSSQTAWSDDEDMLFSDHSRMESYEDVIEINSYSQTDMESHDADILMVDGF
jgi:hypothetical protein